MVVYSDQKLALCHSICAIIFYIQCCRSVIPQTCAAVEGTSKTVYTPSGTQKRFTFPAVSKQRHMCCHVTSHLIAARLISCLRCLWDISSQALFSIKPPRASYPVYKALTFRNKAYLHSFCKGHPIRHTPWQHEA